MEMRKKKKWKEMSLLMGIWEKRKKALELLLRKGRETQDAASSAEDRSRQQHQGQAMAPEGCFWVYVGPEEQRFPVKIKLARHPLFKLLLEEAETEYGFGGEGPIRLPCEVGVFCEVLAEMKEGGEDEKMLRTGCYSPLRIGSPSGRHVRSSLREGNTGSYRLLK